MGYLGDFALGSTFDTKFTTVGTTGAPTQLAGTPVISAYPDNNTTQLTAGITLTVDFDSLTGLNHVRVVATSGNGYAAGNYQLVITTGTVGGTSVVGYVVAEFSIEARSALRPTTAGRTLDVSAGGEAGVDWANVGSPTTTVGLSGTTVKTATDVETDTQDIQSRLPAALVSGRIDATVGAMAANTLTASAIAADAITAAKIADGAIDAGTFAAGAINAAAIAADAITAAKIADGAIDAATFAAGAIDAAAIAANAIGASELAADAANEIADAILDRDMSTGTDSGSTTVRTVRQALRFLRNKWSISGATLTVCKEDDSTTSWTSTVATTAGTDPVTSSDPAGP